MSVAAYPPGHPDHGAQDPAAALALLRPLVEGGPGWGRRDAARLAVRDADGRAVGAAIIADGEARPAEARSSRSCSAFPATTSAASAPPVGRRARRCPPRRCATVGLRVNADNPARGLYLSRGFAPLALSVALRLPGEPGPAVVSPPRPAEP